MPLLSCFKSLYDECYRKLKSEELYARKLGVKVGRECRFVGRCSFGSEPYLISIGNHVSITSSSFVNHDGGVWVFRQEYPKIDVIRTIKIGNNVFIGAGCTFLPGAVVEDNVVVGAGSLVTGVLESNYVYGGVPAKKIKPLDAYKNKCLKDSLDTKGMKNKKEVLKKTFRS